MNPNFKKDKIIIIDFGSQVTKLIARRIREYSVFAEILTLKDLKKKNVFQNLAKFANNDINQHVDLIYTFPNHRSIHTFIKYNDFHTVTVLPLHLRPISVRAFFL